MSLALLILGVNVGAAGLVGLFLLLARAHGATVEWEGVWWSARVTLLVEGFAWLWALALAAALYPMQGGGG